MGIPQHIWHFAFGPIPRSVLAGGETAEMPDMYPVGSYDVSGFVVGAVERSNYLPRLPDLFAGDVVLALPSSGKSQVGILVSQEVFLSVKC